jgi:hypothetical protein
MSKKIKKVKNIVRGWKRDIHTYIHAWLWSCPRPLIFGPACPTLPPTVGLYKTLVFASFIP